MANDKLWGLHFENDNASVDTFVSGVTNVQFNPGLEKFISSFDGRVFDSYVGVMTAKPMATITCVNIDAMMDIVGTIGAHIDDVDIYITHLGACGVRNDSSTMKISFADACVIPRTIDADALSGAPATISFDVIPTSQTLTSPVTISDGVTAGYTSAALPGIFVGGPFLAGSELIAETQSVSFDFGLSEEMTFGDGMPYPKSIWVESRKPVLNVKCLDTEQVLTTKISHLGSVLSADTVYLRRCLQNGTRVDDGSDISLSIASGFHQVDDLTAQHEGLAETSITVTPSYADSAASPYVVYSKAAQAPES